MNTNLKEKTNEKIENFILEGSEKQIAWARKIIGTFFHTMALYQDKLSRLQKTDETSEKWENFLEKSMNDLAREKKASFFIDKRNNFEALNTKIATQITNYLKNKTVLVKK